MKVHFKNTQSFKLIYDDPYIAFSVILNDISNIENIVRYSNYHQGNFVEMRFGKISKRLCDIEMVSIDPSSITIVPDTHTEIIGNDIYDCIITDLDMGFDIDVSTKFPIQVFRFYDSIKIVWGTEHLSYFRITDKCSIGIDNHTNIRGLLLSSLSSDIIQHILG